MEKAFREVKQQVTFFPTDRLDFPSHIHEDIELVFVKRGGGTAYCDGRAYELTEHSVFLVFPNQVHRYTDCTAGEYILLIVKPARLLKDHEIFSRVYPTCALQYVGESDLELLLQMALNEFEHHGGSTVLDAYLTAFFGRLLCFYDLREGVVSTDTVSQILRYCSEHYKEDITVDRISHELHMSKSTVSHIFSLRLAIHFCDHINSLRLADAVQLLKDPQYAVTDVAALAGFPTIRTFNRAFLKQYGVSPSAYRKALSISK